MEDKDLKKILGGLKAPEPDRERKAKAVKAALDAYAAQEDESKGRVKGFDEKLRHTDRRGKNLSGGKFVMRKKIYAAIGLAAIFVVVIMGYFNMDHTSTLYRPVEISENRSAVNIPAPARETDKSGKGQSRGKEIHITSIDVVKGANRPGYENLQKPVEMPGNLQASASGSGAKGDGADRGAAYKTKSASPADMRSEMKAELKDEFGSQGIVGAKPLMKEYSAAKRMEALSPATAPAPDLRQYAGTEYAGRDRFERARVNPVKVASQEPVSTFSIDVDTASYSFVRRALNEGRLPQKEAVRAEEMINYFDYDYVAPDSSTRPFKPTIAVYPSPWKAGNKLVHIGIKAKEAAKTKRPRANLVFLVDVSGSMDSPDKLPLLVNSLKMMVSELRPDDTIAIAVYAGAAGTVLPATSVADKAKIIEALDKLHAGGSTAGGEGIALAYSMAEATYDKDAINRVILATDGDFNVGIRNSDELKGFVERKRSSGITLSVLGFGEGNYNDELMQKLAQNGNGNAAYIDTLNEARKVLVEQAGATLFTVAKDVKVQVEFNPAYVSEYRLIGYETRMLRREDFNNDKIDAGDVGAGHSVTAIYEITPKGANTGLVDPLRYGKGPDKVEDKVKDEGAGNSEYAYLKLRYKLPKEDKSRLMEIPINAKLEYDDVSKAPTDVRFAASVAGFAQILKGGEFIGDYSYDDVIGLASKSRGEDRFGYRVEFVNLVRLAKSANAMGKR